jgi:hypothetical protein
LLWEGGDPFPSYTPKNAAIHQKIKQKPSMFLDSKGFMQATQPVDGTEFYILLLTQAYRRLLGQSLVAVDATGYRRENIKDDKRINIADRHTTQG